MEHNKHEIETIKQLAKQWGVDELKLKSVQVYDLENNADLIPTEDAYARYEKAASGELKIKNKLLNHCWKLWHSCVVTWDGKVAPCCFDKDASHRLGDMKINTFEDIWQNEKYQSFRSKILDSRSSIDICTNCSEGTKVWIEE
jgi:radical SAM protein with 4Fe4S-binding SPASM domain